MLSVFVPFFHKQFIVHIVKDFKSFELWLNMQCSSFFPFLYSIQLKSTTLAYFIVIQKWKTSN